MRTLYILAVLSSLLLLSNVSFSQCSTCTYTVSTNTGGNYNLNSGQTLCILSGATFTGNINVNGGTICNSGTLRPSNMNFNSGKFYNNGTFSLTSGFSFNGEVYNTGNMSISGDLNINSSGKFQNMAGATLAVGNSLNNNHIFINEGTASVNGNYAANSGSGNVNQNLGNLYVKGNLNLNSAFTNAGPLKVDGNVAVNGGSSLTNAAKITINVLGSYTNNATTTNDGTIEIGGTFTNNGGAVYTNNQATNVFGNFMNNGVINGDSFGCNAFTAGGTSVVQNGGATINNNDFCASMFPGNHFSQNNGSMNSVTYCTCSQTITPLPIELTSFTARCEGGEVMLEWTTASEINNSFFTVSRSADAITWETVTVLAGAGSSNAPLDYTAQDSRPLGDVSYYRLQQTDYDGTSESFAPVSVSCDKSATTEMSIFPNPAQEQFTVQLFAQQADANAVLDMLDVTGKKVAVRNVQIQSGQNQILVDRNGLEAGTYFVRVATSLTEYGIQKVVLQ